MSEEKAPAEGEGEGKPKSKKKLFIIIGVVVLLIGAGVPAFLLMGKKKEVEQHVEEKETKKHYKLVTFPTFIVNLSESSSFVKVTMQIEYDPEILDKATHSAAGGEGHAGGGSGGGGDAAGAGAMPPHFQERDPMIKDAVIRVLSSKKTAEVLTVDGKDQLKEELIEAINTATGLEEGPVVAIYFTEFIIQ